MSLAIKALWEPVRTLGFAAIGPAYEFGVGTALNFPSRQVFIQNFTDAPLMFSFDGVHDHFPLPAGSFLLDDVSSNKTLDTGYFFAKGDRLYVRSMGAAPTTNAVWFSSLYGIDY